jgi:MYXO-CTERM domain-containing protein
VVPSAGAGGWAALLAGVALVASRVRRRAR